MSSDELDKLSAYMKTQEAKSKKTKDTARNGSIVKAIKNL
jgi:hypothetical protein